VVMDLDAKLATILGIGAGLFALAHQGLLYGDWFDIGQILHHETIAITIFAFLVGLWVEHALELSTKGKRPAERRG